MLVNVENARELMKFCFVPELKQDLDNIHIQNEHFTEYRKALEEQLPILYDLVEQNKDWISNTNEQEVQELQASLIVLICEVHASTGEIYKINNSQLLKNANRLLRQYTNLSEAVMEIIFSYYQNKLQKHCWKLQLGAVHGFMRFLEMQYNEETKNVHKMSSKLLTFCLSIGLNVRECHDPIYKQIGTRIFYIILNYAHVDEVVNLNIHSVIYDAVLNDVHYMDSIIATADIWQCLYKCLDYFRDLDSLSWSYVDDMIEILLRNIALAPNALISICLLKFVTKLCAYFTINHEEIEAKYNADLSIPQNLYDCRNICSENSSYTIFRWAKAILGTFMSESYKLMQSASICRQFLLEMHRCYMVCILPINLQLLEPHLLPFLDKFTTQLMAVIVAQKHDKDIIKLIHDMIETFHLQLQRSPYCQEHSNLLRYREAFEKLLQHKSFVTNN